MDFIVNDQQTLTNVHTAEQCLGITCTIHKPTKHHMRDWPLYWRADRRIFERMCKHGIGHNDPDQYYFNDDNTHGCDFCCLT